jgi:hypothetical protein
VIWGLSLHGWEEVMRLSLAVVGIFGLAVGVATYFVVTLQREELAHSKEEFERFKVEAKTTGEKAQADIAKANAEIAEAKRQTALLEKQAAEARVDQERLKASVVWRSIPKAIGDRISVRLAARKGTVRLLVLANDPEGMAFSSMLTRILANAKWEAFAEAGSWVNWLPVGVSIYGPNDDLVKFVLNSFKAEGIEFSDAKPLREPDIFARQDVGGLGDVTILVGARLGPL